MLSPADEALLNDLLDGRLAPAEAARLRARIDSDRALRTAYEGLERVRALLRDDMGLEAPEDLPARVRAQHEAGAQAAAGPTGPGRAPSLPPAWRRVVVAAYALAAMLVVAVGAIALQHGRQQEPAPVLDARARWAREVPSAQSQAPADESAPPAQVQAAAPEARPLADARGAPEGAAPAGSVAQAPAALRAPPLAGATAPATPPASRAPDAAPAAAPPTAPAAPPAAPAPDDTGWSPPPELVRKAKAEAWDRAQDLQRERAAASPPRMADAPAPQAETAGEKDRLAPAEPARAGELARRAEPGRSDEREGGQGAAPASAGDRDGAQADPAARLAPVEAPPGAAPFQAPGGAVPPGVRRSVAPGEAVQAPARGAPAAAAEPQAARAKEAAREVDAARALEHVFVIEAASADEARAVLERVLAGPGAGALPPEPGFTAVRLRRADAQQDAALLVSLGVLPPPAGAPSAEPRGGGGGGEAGRGAARPPTLPRVLADVQRAVNAEQYGRLAALAGRGPAAPEAARAADGTDLRLLRILVVAPRR